MPPPTLFIGSSSESLAVVQLLVKKLSGIADVRPWSDKGFFQPGLYYLDNLIYKLPEFDFAVFIFGPDDAVESRGVVQSAPRDNVIFEFGYALAHLRRERVFHLVPKGPNLNVKVMSDLAGLKHWEYQLPDDFHAKLSDLNPKSTALPAAEKEHYLKAVDEALDAPCTYIAETVRRMGPRVRFDRGVAEGPQYVTDVYDDILRAMDRPGRNEVVNIALDMEQTWPAVRDRFLLDPDCPRGQWRSLIIDPRSPTLKQLEGPAFSTSIAAAMIANMTTVGRAEAGLLARGPLSYQCRAYDAPPSVHGFLVNDRTAFISLCGLSSKWSDGTSSPYLQFQKGRGIKAADHMVDSFRTLFDFQWKRARRIWPAR